MRSVFISVLVRISSRAVLRFEILFGLEATFSSECTFTSCHSSDSFSCHFSMQAYFDCSHVLLFFLALFLVPWTSVMRSLL